MLEKPDLPDEQIIRCLRDAYGLTIAQVAFLPLGADVNTAVYRVEDEDGTPYFLKLRSGVFDEATVTVPELLRERGMAQVIAPIKTRDGRLWTRMDGFAVILSPFVAGRNGFAIPLSDRHWHDLGSALKIMHTTDVPESLRRRIPHETFGSHWRDIVRAFQAHVEGDTFADAVAAQLAAFMRAEREKIADLVSRAERLGDALRERPLENVLCHADIHAGNVLIEEDDTLHIVDWDTLILAPKERDLMFIGAGVGENWNSARESDVFYAGYGPTEIDPMALAYYRYERIVEDFAAYGEQLFLTDEGGADRPDALRRVVGQFQPGRVIEIAYATDTSRA